MYPFLNVFSFRRICGLWQVVIALQSNDFCKLMRSNPLRQRSVSFVRRNLEIRHIGSLFCFLGSHTVCLNFVINVGLLSLIRKVLAVFRSQTHVWKNNINNLLIYIGLRDINKRSQQSTSLPILPCEGKQ